MYIYMRIIFNAFRNMRIFYLNYVWIYLKSIHNVNKYTLNKCTVVFTFNETLNNFL